ncbi:MAG TPA: hypothetical protein VGD40_07160 [Chryseosolibacter sp.]
MKTTNKSHFLLMAGIVAVFAAFTVSCNKDDDPSLADLREDKLQYLEDSLRISDSLRLIGNAGVVNYAVTVVDASASSIYNNGTDAGGNRSEATQSAVDGAIVTISQYGKTLSDTTDASGMVVFNGFFRSAVNISVRKADYTTVTYISAVNVQDSTRTGTISFVGNIIPIFATTGPTTATISGRATIETNLTNRTVELAPDGTRVSATIDARHTSSAGFAGKFLTSSIADKIWKSTCGCQFIYLGNILQASYSTGAVGTVTGGNYSITVPAAVDGLPLTLQYSDIGADQTLFQLDGDDQNVITKRVVFEANASATAATVPSGSTVTVDFESVVTDAAATAIISENTGTIERINVTNGGLNYNGVPLVEITGGGGTGATATATVGANGRVTGITLTNPGTGYTSVPSVNIISGSGATASTVLAGTGTVIALNLITTGAGYTSAPTVDITGGGATTNATATATIANGRVTGLTLTSGGVGYDGSPITVTLNGGGFTTQATATAVFSGRGIGVVTLTSGGTDYTYAPLVTFSAPDLPTGTRPTATATFDPDTREVTGINVSTNGSGYLVAPTITLTAGSAATAEVFITGGSVISFDITNEGVDYAYPPTIVIGYSDNGQGSGATATPVMANGRLVGINVTNPGSGYITAPSVDIVVGSGAVAHPVVNASGAITSYIVTKGGSGYNGAPRVYIDNSSSTGAGATATATVSGGAVTGVTAVLGGSNYEAGNTPSSAVNFSTTKGSTIETKPGLNYINDVTYGTGTIRE